MSCGHHRVEDPAFIGGAPVNVIVMWEQREALIPKGWVLANGLNGTPDLRGFTIKGAPHKLYSSPYDSLTRYTKLGFVGGESTPTATLAGSFSTTFTTVSNLQLTFTGSTVTVTSHSLPSIQISTHTVTQPASHAAHTITFNSHADHIATNALSHSNINDSHTHDHGHSAGFWDLVQIEARQAISSFHAADTYPHTPESHPGFTVSGHTAHSPISFTHDDHVVTVADASITVGHGNPGEDTFGEHYNSAGLSQPTYTPIGTITASAVYTQSHSHIIDWRPSYRKLYFIMKL